MDLQERVETARRLAAKSKDAEMRDAFQHLAMVVEAAVSRLSWLEQAEHARPHTGPLG